ncbi:hypothetical protein [Rhizobium sp. NPDC090279]|uniref:hypothetical protein n=1 Tax=Rhizobium sp. NPDC090279 TaxID=3364499 RepID=UPI00383BBDD6
MTSLVLQPESPKVAITRAMAAVLLKVMSDLKYRLVNDISSPLMNQSDGRVADMTLLFTSLWPFRDGKAHNHVVRHSSSPIMHNVTTVKGRSLEAGTNGIAIRACFGKPAFAWMQQGQAKSARSE